MNPPAPILARRCPAYSLVELVLALAVLAILLIGAQSAILLATRALPTADSPNAGIVSASQAFQLICTDLGDAVSVTRATAADLEFTVPDRTADGAPETIRYFFQGNLLRRTVNGIREQILIRKPLSFSFECRTRAGTDPTTYADGGELLLASNDSALNLADYPVDNLHFIGTTVRPVLPADASSWALTRVKIKARPNGVTAGVAKVQVRRALTDLPTTTVLDDATLVESLLPLAASYSWQDFTFPKAPRFNPGESAAIVVQWSADTVACDVQYQNAGVAAANLALTLTDTGGGAWRAVPGQSLCFYAYGRIASPVPTTTSKLLTAVHIAVVTEGGTHLRTTARVPNLPKVEAP
jgi:hypothetical protein